MSEAAAGLMSTVYSTSGPALCQTRSLIAPRSSAEQTVEHGKGTPLGRPAQPEEIAPAFVFFASEADSSYINGEILTLLGGEVRAG